MKVTKHKDIVGDKLKFLRENQKERHTLSLEKRGIKILPPVIIKYLTSPKQIKKVKLQAAATGKGSVGNYNRSLLDLEKYLLIEDEDLKDLDEDRILDYLDYLDEISAKYNYVKNVKPAVMFLVLALNLPDLWFKGTQRAYDGLLKRAACEKKPVKKGYCLPLSVLEQALKHYITPHLLAPHKVSYFLLFEIKNIFASMI